MLYGGENWRFQIVVLIGWEYSKEIFPQENVTQLMAVAYDVLYTTRNGFSYIRIQV
jgi:hypothetical protein